MLSYSSKPSHLPYSEYSSILDEMQILAVKLSFASIYYFLQLHLFLYFIPKTNLQFFKKVISYLHLRVLYQYSRNPNPNIDNVDFYLTVIWFPFFICISNCGP